MIDSATTAKTTISKATTWEVCGCKPETPPPTVLYGVSNTFPVIIGKHRLPKRFGTKHTRHHAGVLEVYSFNHHLETDRWSSRLNPGIYFVAGVRNGHTCDEQHTIVNQGERVYVKIDCRG